jgi:hypothetical protein
MSVLDRPAIRCDGAPYHRLACTAALGRFKDSDLAGIAALNVVGHRSVPLASEVALGGVEPPHVDPVDARQRGGAITMVVAVEHDD